MDRFVAFWGSSFAKSGNSLQFKNDSRASLVRQHLKKMSCVAVEDAKSKDTPKIHRNLELRTRTMWTVSKLCTLVKTKLAYDKCRLGFILLKIRQQ